MHNRSKAPWSTFFQRGRANMVSTLFWWEVWHQRGGRSLQFCPFSAFKFHITVTIFYLSLYLSLSLLCPLDIWSISPVLFIPIAPSTQIRLMVGGSISLAPNPLSADGLPLIICIECGLRMVVRHRSQQPWSAGQIFYCCPLHKVRIRHA